MSYQDVRIVCFPPAGGSATMTRSWDLNPQTRVETFNVRRHRSRSPHLGLVDLAQQIADELDTSTPYALVGHSLGGMLAHEVTRHLLNSARRGPETLVLMGTRPPHTNTAALFADTATLDDEAFLDRLLQLGALEPELRDHPLVSMMIPALRADLRLVGSYAPDYTQMIHEPLSTRVHVWAGVKDPLAPPILAREWSPYAESVHCTTFSGDHHFPTRQGADVGQALTHLLLWPLARAG